MPLIREGRNIAQFKKSNISTPSNEAYGDQREIVTSMKAAVVQQKPTEIRILNMNSQQEVHKLATIKRLALMITRAFKSVYGGLFTSYLEFISKVYFPQYISTKFLGKMNQCLEISLKMGCLNPPSCALFAS